MADSSGELVTGSTQRYLPFGAERLEAGSPTDYGFTGQRSLSSIGLLDYNARWYDPMLSRFTQPDTIVPDLFSPQSLNRYAYVLNNPINYVDPFGYSVDCGIGDPYCHAGRLDTQGRAVNLAQRYWEERRRGHLVTWNGLSDEDRAILVEGVFSEGSYEDAIGPSASNADLLHDPAIWVVAAFDVVLLAPDLIATVSTLFAIASANGDPTNELTITERLQQLANQAVIKVESLGLNAYSEPQRNAMANNPKIAPMFKGNVIHRAWSNLIEENLPGLQTTGLFKFGPDVIDPVSGHWWDLTTEAQWAYHLNKYINIFGSNGSLIRYYR